MNRAAEIRASRSVVGIDPGRHTGVAVLYAGELTELYTWEKPSAKSVMDFVGGTGLAPVFVVERQFAPNNTNFDSIDTLLQWRHLWETICELQGMHCELVYPATWQSFWYKGFDRSKQGSIAHARSLEPRQNWTEHSADAFGIASWYRRKQMEEGIAL